LIIIVLEVTHQVPSVLFGGVQIYLRCGWGLNEMVQKVIPLEVNAELRKDEQMLVSIDVGI
jgi:hypothetical protein